jgi:RimJ/RimL family protein N-acetyltransferase
MLRLERFEKNNYRDLISWIDSEETLMQVAGPSLTFPLTPEQLDISLSDENRIAFAIINNETNVVAGHAEIYLAESSAKLGRIIIGDKEQRGKGLGEQLVKLLLDIAFFSYNRTEVELNVFDWNTSAIKCYKKVGFIINPNKTLERKIKDKVWIAINMTINKEKWTELKNIKNDK